MPYFPVDDQMPFHPKIIAAGNAAVGVWTRAGAWSKGHATGGFVPTEIASILGTREANRLVEAGLWVEVDGGFRFEDTSPFKPPKRPWIPISIRHSVMERDGYACVFCGSTQELSLDHITRVREGGPDTIDNLRVLCMPCNLERG